MKKLFHLVLMLNMFQYLQINAQNLVPNPSFERVDTCYDLSGGINAGLIPPWDSPTDGTADGYNTCSNSVGGGSSVPVNGFGYQYPHTGNGYVGAGFYGFDISFTNCSSVHYYIEYIQIELDSPLVSHEKYCTSFYVNHANRYYRTALGNFGMYFSTTHTYVPTTCELNYIPQITEPNIISDDSAWTLVYGQFTAVGGEKYIIIGNFNSDSTSDTVHLVNGFPANGYQAYYYIDDVNVHCCTCDSVNTGVGELTNRQNDFKLYPNPNSGNMTFAYWIADNSTGRITIYDITGRMVKEYPINSKSTTLSISDGELQSGTYYYTIIVDDKREKSEKIVIIK